MAEDQQHTSVDGENGKPYRICDGPVVRFSRGDAALPNDWPASVELPRVYGGEPLLIAIPRDPDTLFVYWLVDWSSIFEKTAPVDRQVHLRLYRNDGTEELSESVEPMAGSHYLNVPEQRGTYRTELGYYQPESTWNSIASSEFVSMPSNSVAEKSDVDLATIPFHLSFQRLIDFFRASNRDAITEIVSRLQNRAVSDEERDLLTAQDWAILRAMDTSLEQLDRQRRDRFNVDRKKLRSHAEALLGFGSTSPSRGFSGSSRG